MINDILNTGWNCWMADWHPIDRRMKAVQDKLGSPDMSMENTRFLINEIVRRHASEFYLEVGVWVGHSLLSAAMYNEDITCIGIENFADHPDKERLKRNITNHFPTNAFVINGGFEDVIPALTKLEGKVDVFYYDGNHSHHATMLGLYMVQPLMANHSFILLDDLVQDRVRWAKDRFLAACPIWKERFCYIPDIEHGPWYTGFCVLERK